MAQVNKNFNNIIIMGKPGAGKTTIAQLLGQHLNMNVVDVDNDILENVWGMTVAEKLFSVGSGKFINEEGQATTQIQVQNSVIALTGSNPLHKEAMEYIKTLGVIVYLDICDKDILSRLEQMKVNRIVGQEVGTPMQDILNYRTQFYEANYDVRVLCEEGEAVREVLSKTLEAIKRFAEPLTYKSTRSEKKTGDNFLDVVLQGLAPDGGLFVPAEGIPTLTQGQLKRLLDLSHEDLALRILEQWIPTQELHPSELKNMISKVYTKDNFTEGIAPIVHLENNEYVLELFHGPTASFKDHALQLMPQFFDAALSSRAANNKFASVAENNNTISRDEHKFKKQCENLRRKKHLLCQYNNKMSSDEKLPSQVNDQMSFSEKQRHLILVATSGDTGSAVLHGFKRFPRVPVIVLYPRNGVSDIQRKLMTTVEESNVSVIGVDGDFDFCQSCIKTVFNDTDLCNKFDDIYAVKFSAANSINWGRLLPQIVYYISGYLNLVERNIISFGEKIDICVPTGNFGNILAAYYSKRMGVPIDRLILAANVNNVLNDFIETGEYDIEKRSLHCTASPSIDILKSSNLERYLYHVTNGDSKKCRDWYQQLNENRKFKIDQATLREVQKEFTSGWCSEEDCLQTVKEVFKRTEYLMDPHTAVAKAVVDKISQSTAKKILIVSTAHYAKFPSNIINLIEPSYLNTSKHNESEILDLLENRKLEPEMHRNVQQCLLKTELHTTVCGAAYSSVVDELEKFVQSLS